MNLRPVFYGLVGALRLVRLDKTGAHIMLGGKEGFWASLLWPMALLAPLYGLLSLLRFDPSRYENGWRYLFVHGEIYILTWLLVPLLMIPICAVLNRRRQYLDFVIGYNWLLCLINLFQIILSLANASHMVGFNAAAALTLGLAGASALWIGLLAHDRLRIPFSAAIGIVILDLFLAVSVGLFRSYLLGS